MRNSAAKRIIAVLLCLVIFAGSELSGLTNIVGDLFATEMPAADEEGNAPVTQKAEVEIMEEAAAEVEAETEDTVQEEELEAPEAPAESEGNPDEKETPDASEEKPADTQKPDASEENPGEEETPDASEEKPADTQTPDAPEENPGENETPDVSEEKPADTQTPDASEEKPADTQTPDVSEEKPGETQIPEESKENTDEAGMPGIPEDKETLESPETEKPDAVDEEEPEEALEDSMTPEEFEALGEDEVGAVTWEMEAPVSGFRRARAGSGTPFTFNIQYVKQDDPNYVYKEDNFNLKYQIGFTVPDVDLQPGDIKIQMPYALFQDRNGNPVGPDQIAVAKGEPGAEDDDKNSGSSAFKYCLDDEANPQWLIFYNCRTVKSGTNSMWQVLYKVTDIMQVKDQTSWSLAPEVAVTVRTPELDDEGKPEKDENGDIIYTVVGEYSTEYETEEDGKFPYGPVDPLEGLVDTSVSLTSVTKEPYYEANRQYAPGLYTRAQVARYAGYGSEENLPEQFRGEKFKDYRYVVWEVTAKGTATQPWSLQISEKPKVGTGPEGTQEGTEGILVGYCDNYKTSLGYNVPIQRPEHSTGEDTLIQNYGLGADDTRSWGSRFYVVTAYPRTAAPKEDALLENELTVTMVPEDEDGEPVSETRNAEWKCKDYKWEYIGDTISVHKYYYNGDNENGYSGWLDAYQKAKESGEDYGDLPFSTTYSFKGYQWTHALDSSTGMEPGSVIPDRSYKLTAVDDVMYVWPEDKDGRMLTGKDYYFSEVTVTPSYLNVDLFEDQEIPQDSTKGELTLYAMYPESTDWEKVPEEHLSASKTGLQTVYSLNEAELARQPWRVKAEYTAEDAYRISCVIDVKVRLRQDSEVLSEILKDNPNLQSIKLEDLSGATGQFGSRKPGEAYTYASMTYVDGSGGDSSDGDASLKPDQNSGKLNYESYEINGSNELADITRRLYGGFLLRDNDSKKLTSLTPHAQATKTSVSTNDSAGDRVVVDYCLTAYDGYEVYSKEAKDFLQSNSELNPGQNHVVFYDLLPYGMKFDPSRPVTAGRIRDLDSRGNYTKQPGLWDTTQVRVEVDSRRDIDTNYNGTSRTRVAFHVWYDGADPTTYTNGMWMEGWGVSFSAYYERKDVELIQKESNVCAFMPSDPSRSLIGKKNEEIFPDNGGANLPASMNEALKEEYKALGSNINGASSVNEEVYNVLYARDIADEDIAQSGETGIKKTVIADADRFGKPGTSAEVETGKGYTYEITVGNTDAGSWKGLIVYDVLESAEGSQWKGEFQSVDVSGLRRIGIDPVVYYTDNENPDKNLEAEGSGWTKAEDWDQDPDAGSKTVRAVAVDMRKSSEGGDFELKSMQNAGFQIRMKVPEGTQKDQAAKNEAFYGVEGSTELLRSNPVTVTVKPMEILTVTKKLADNVPEEIQNSAKNTFFEFELYKVENGTEKKLAGQEYRLYENGELKDDRLYATDGKGCFRLRPDQTAEFQLPNADGIQARETEQIFWKGTSNAVDNRTDENGRRAITVTNEYRPVVYVRKLLQGTLDTEEGIEDAQTRFQFKIETRNSAEEEFTPLANKEFYYVDSVGVGGVLPGPHPDYGTSLTGCMRKTDENGIFTLKKGEVAALCFEAPGIQYRITEVTEDGTGIDATGNWICQTPFQSGTTSLEGEKAEFTNIYRWKELYITKKLTNQDPKECKQEFTFKIQKVTTTEDGTTQETDLSLDECKKITWYLTGSGTQTPQELDRDGTITCQCAGRTIRVSGLEAGVTYKVTELPDESGDYQQTIPAGGEGILVTMPEYGTRKDISFTNDYLWRSLSVSKQLAAETEKEGETEEPSFPMTVTLKGELQKGLAYTLMKQGKEVPLPDGVIQRRTDLTTGIFWLKSGETAVFQYAGKVGDLYEITEVHEKDLTEPEKYPQIYPEDNKPFTGNFPKEDVDVTFINGKAGSLYISKAYIYDPKDKAAVSYLENAGGGWDQTDPPVLAQENQSSLGILDVLGGNGSSLDQENQQPGDGAESFTKTKKAVSVQLYLNGELFTESCEVKVIDKSGNILKDQWPSESEDSLNSGVYLLEPDVTVIIPDSVLAKYQKDGVTAYELREAPEDQHRIEQTTYQKGASGQVGMYVSAVVEISQSDPKDDAAVTGTVEHNPVASIENEVKGHDVMDEKVKFMTEDSEKVPEGSRLVWRLERYTSGGWVPAAGVSYVRFTTREGTADPSNGLISPQEVVPMDDRIQTTGADGRIELYKTEGGVPIVDFLGDERVYLNLSTKAQEGDLRLVEVWEESDAAWGMLAGYADNAVTEADSNIHDTDMAEDMVAYNKDNIFRQAGQSARSDDAGSMTMESSAKKAKAVSGRRTGPLSSGNRRPLYPETLSDSQFSLAVGEAKEEDARTLYIGFVNSNKKIPVEIAKEMETGSDEIFTMLLEQVLLLNEKDPAESYKKDLSSVKAEDILLSQGRGGIPYEVYHIQEPEDGSGQEPVRTGETGPEGEILLRAGEYARLDLPEGTLWTVREKEKAGYELKDLRPDSQSGRLQKIAGLSGNRDTMLIYQTPSRLPAELNVEVIKGKVYYDEVSWYLGVLDLSGEDPYRPAVNLLNGYIRISGTYSDGTVKELTPGVGSLRIEDLKTGGMSQEDIIRENRSEELKWKISWEGMTKEVSLTYMPVQSLTSKVLEQYVTDMDFEQDYMSRWILRPFDYHVKVQAVYSDGTARDLDGSQVKAVRWQWTFEDDSEENGNENGDLSMIHEGGRNADLKVTFVPDHIPVEQNRSSTAELKYLASVIGTGVFHEFVTGAEKLYSVDGDPLDLQGPHVVIPALVRIAGSEDTIFRVTSIGGSAFADNETIESVEIPMGVSEINNRAFGGCTNLRSVKLPDSVTEIYWGAFSGCSSLTEITIPSRVSKIEENAFEGCENLTRIVVEQPKNSLAGYKTKWGAPNAQVVWSSQNTGGISGPGGLLQ